MFLVYTVFIILSFLDEDVFRLPGQFSDSSVVEKGSRLAVHTALTVKGDIPAVFWCTCVCVCVCVWGFGVYLF